ncbi:hypothetical protein [Saccharibacillus alkalitolerans]|uniref:Uncharacterized protein n=1 Tax=Saccharibacillus alkalitolerans TaxID=2705290 RepID=A0ABX0F612_9BACL|nr:hypothetical protein [Saccharibacillus alkalitolerans]NGZ75048.1 hypothetical protein [Saccharibacillus alkalitolerans]
MHNPSHNPSAADYYSGKTPWIRDKKRFRRAMILTAVLTLLSIRYPGTRPLYEETLLALHIPLSIPLPGGGNFNYSGLIFLGFGLRALFLIWDSLNRHRILFCLALLWLLPMLSKAALTGYQMLVPSGVYALAVDQDQSNCTYQFEDGKVAGQCSILVKNNSGSEVTIQPRARIDYGSADGQQGADVSFDPIVLPPRQARYVGPEFSAELAGEERGTTGSGFAHLGSGFILTLDDGKRARTWSD